MINCEQNHPYFPFSGKCFFYLPIKKFISFVLTQYCLVLWDFLHCRYSTSQWQLNGNTNNVLLLQDYTYSISLVIKATSVQQNVASHLLLCCTSINTANEDDTKNNNSKCSPIMSISNKEGTIKILRILNRIIYFLTSYRAKTLQTMSSCYFISSTPGLPQYYVKVIYLF